MLVSASLAAQTEDVTFLVMGKTSNYRQERSGERALLNYHFFAEIFVKPRGRVANARLTFPDGHQLSFEDHGYVFEVHGKRFDNEPALDRTYPNGDYVFRFETSSGDVRRVLSVRGTGEGASRIPAAPRIILKQDGREVAPLEVDPERDLEVTWSPFAAAEPDPHGILDDLLFVVMGDCHGERTVHSGRPFEGTSYLDFRSKGYTIPAAKLRPGEPHQLSVEQAKVDTSRENGLVGLVTYAATTFLDFRTTGDAAREPCPAVMPKIDAGQTDRPERK